MTFVLIINVGLRAPINSTTFSKACRDRLSNIALAHRRGPVRRLLCAFCPCSGRRTVQVSLRLSLRSLVGPSSRRSATFASKAGASAWGWRRPRGRVGRGFGRSCAGGRPAVPAQRPEGRRRRLLRRGRGLVRRGEGVGGDGRGSSAAAKGSAMEQVRPVASQQVVAGRAQSLSEPEA